MKSLMSKLLITLLGISSLGFADTAHEAKVIDFLKKSIQTGGDYSLKNVMIHSSSSVEGVPGWTTYFVKIDLDIKSKQKTVSLTDMVFSNGVVLTKELFALSNGKNIKETLSPDVDPVLYDENHLIEGNYQAPNKLLVFSDPLCPFCIDFIPELIRFVKANQENFALFYYHRPLSQIHPAAVGLIKAMEAAKKQGVKDVILKSYEEVFDLSMNDETKILAAFNKALGTNVTLEEMNTPAIIKELEHDISVATAMLVRGTPTLFVNGKRDNTRAMHKKLLKEKK